MQAKVITLRYSSRLGGFDTTEFDEFSKDKEIQEIREQFFQVDGIPHLSLLIFFSPAELPSPKSTTDKDAYKKVLNDKDWPLFKTLRDWRADGSYVDRILRLSLPAPDIIDSILEGNEPDRLSLEKLVKGFPMEWDKQNSQILVKKR